MMATERSLCAAVEGMLDQDPALRDVLGFDPVDFTHDGELVAEILARAVAPGRERDAVRILARNAFAPGSDLFDMVREDALVTATRDQDPGGAAASLLSANGLHNLLSYRLTHSLHEQGRAPLAHALKTHFLRAFGADIMPGARIGRRVWIDHGLGVVIGQTAVIEEDVSLWHGVTLGTNLVDRGPARHPRLRRGAIIGAGAKLIGPIEIGAGAIVAAGATVVENVPAGAIAVGPRGRILQGRARPASELGIRIGEL